jgi:hypothetical protein
VADGSSGLQVIDVSNPQSFQIVGSVDTPGTATSVALSGTLAYIADDVFGLQVVDVSIAENPHMVGCVDTPGEAFGVAISGTHAFVADYSRGLQVIDITDPESPQIVGTVDTPDYAFGVDVTGTHAYVADGFSGLQVIDGSNPQSPRITGSVVTPVHAFGVAVSGAHAYVTTDLVSGLRVLPTQCELATGVAGNGGVPTPIALRIFPNPTSRYTVIHVETGTASPVRAEIYDVAGRLISHLLDETPNVRDRDLRWDGRDNEGRTVASGIYFVRVSTAERSEVARLVVVK